jgi:RadC-like JAB domain
MPNQNRASEKAKLKSRGPQAKQPAAPSRWTSFREVKVITVREEPAPGPSPKLDDPDLIFALWRRAIANAPWFSEDKEHLVCFCLDTRYRLKSFSLVSIGSLNETIAECREIFRPAVADAAFAIIVAHNHPSGDPSPSHGDRALTRRIYSAGELLGIKLLDHIIVGDNRCFSFHGEGWPPSEGSLSDYDAPLAAPTIAHSRQIVVRLTKKQWRTMRSEAAQGSVKRFLEIASRRQLLRLKHATPLRYEFSGRTRFKHGSPASFVFVRNLRRCETENWKRAKFQRRLVASALKQRGIATARAK